MDNADLIEATEHGIDNCLEQAHKSGLTYWNLLWILLSLTRELYLKAEAEYQSKLS